MLKMVTLECPKCGASLNADDREVFFCSHCGAKIMLHNENEHVYHIIKESIMLCEKTLLLFKY